MTARNYPYGVTGNEPQIRGFPPCGECGHEAEDHTTANDGDPCDECNCSDYNLYPPEPPEELYEGWQLSRFPYWQPTQWLQ